MNFLETPKNEEGPQMCLSLICCERVHLCYHMNDEALTSIHQIKI